MRCKEKKGFTGEIKVSDSGRRMAKGLCPVCGASLNDVDPAEHRHEPEPDPRWAKLRELRFE